MNIKWYFNTYITYKIEPDLRFDTTFHKTKGINRINYFIRYLRLRKHIWKRYPRKINEHTTYGYI